MVYEQQRIRPYDEVYAYNAYTGEWNWYEVYQVREGATAYEVKPEFAPTCTGRE